MTPRPMTFSANYLAVVRGLRELHRLTLDGRQDSPEADAVRDATDLPWSALTEVEKKRLAGLSEDLYSITDPPSADPLEMNPQVQARLVEIAEARRRGEWDQALDLLRRWARYIDPDVLSYMRGATWLDAGDPETAALFFEHASSLRPENGIYLATLLATLNRFDPRDARRRAEEILGEPDRFMPVAVVQAADTVISSIPSLSQDRQSRLYRQLIPLLESALQRMEGEAEGGVQRSTLSLTFALLGLCHQMLGERRLAERAYTRGLTADPTNCGLLAARGMLLYGESSRAVTDLESAIQHGSPMISPYYILAHHSLLSGRFDRCRTLCERALEMQGSDAVKSELAEWLAIAQSELGYPADLIRGSFEHAIARDPSNDRARRNLAIFERLARPAPSGSYETRDQGAVRISGLSEQRIRPAA